MTWPPSLLQVPPVPKSNRMSRPVLLVLSVHSSLPAGLHPHSQGLPSPSPAPRLCCAALPRPECPSLYSRPLRRLQEPAPPGSPPDCFWSWKPWSRYGQHHSDHQDLREMTVVDTCPSDSPNPELAHSRLKEQTDRTGSAILAYDLARRRVVFT